MGDHGPQQTYHGAEGVPPLNGGSSGHGPNSPPTSQNPNPVPSTVFGSGHASRAHRMRYPVQGGKGAGTGNFSYMPHPGSAATNQPTNATARQPQTANEPSGNYNNSNNSRPSTQGNNLTAEQSPVQSPNMTQADLLLCIQNLQNAISQIHNQSNSHPQASNVSGLDHQFNQNPLFPVAHNGTQLNLNPFAPNQNANWQYGGDRTTGINISPEQVQEYDYWYQQQVQSQQRHRGEQWHTPPEFREENQGQWNQNQNGRSGCRPPENGGSSPSDHTLPPGGGEGSVPMNEAQDAAEYRRQQETQNRLKRYQLQGSTCNQELVGHPQVRPL